MSLRSVHVALVLSVLSVVASLMPVGLAGAAQADDPRTASVSGRVSLPVGVDPTTVSVLAKRWDEDRQSWHVDGWVSYLPLTPDGSYTFPQLLPGDYVIEVTQPDGAIASGYSYPQGGSGLQRVRLTAGERREGLDFTISLGATLSGRVRVLDRVEATDLRVTMHRKLADGTFAAERVARVAADGTWSHSQLLPGTYRVSVTHDDDVTWPAFLGGADLKSAREVVVSAGREVSGLDLSVRRSGALTGHVDFSALTDDESRRCVTVTAYSRGAKGWSQVAESKVSEDGAYAVRGLRTGVHRLGFRDTCLNYTGRVVAAHQFFPNALEVGRAGDLVVTDGADRGVATFEVAPAGHLSGYLHVYDRGTVRHSEGRRVELLRRSGLGWEVVAERRTEGSSYRFAYIPAGQYRIGFARGDKELREVFHPSALTLAGARTFTLPTGMSHMPLFMGEAVTWRRDAKVVLAYEPYVTGSARVGRSLRTQAPRYAQQDMVTVRYQWQLRRNGKVRNISGATVRRLELKARHRGARVRLRVIATAKAHQRHVHRSPWSRPVRGR